MPDESPACQAEEGIGAVADEDFADITMGVVRQ